MIDPKDYPEARGTALNRLQWGETLELFGDKERAVERPTTVIKFPGGHVEVTRASDGTHWAHISTQRDNQTDDGEIIGARIDFAGRYSDELNRLLFKELSEGGCKHIALRIAESNQREAGQ